MVDQREPLRLFESAEAPVQLRRLLMRAHEDVPSLAEQERLVEAARRRSTAGGSAGATSRLRWAARVARHVPKLVSAIALVGAGVGVGVGVHHMSEARHRQAAMAGIPGMPAPLGREAPLIVPMEAPNAPVEDLAPGAAQVTNDSPRAQAPVRPRPHGTMPSAATTTSDGAGMADRSERPGEGRGASDRSGSGSGLGSGSAAGSTVAGSSTVSRSAASGASRNQSTLVARRERSPSMQEQERSVDGSGSGEAALLLEARQALVTSPARALFLAQEHLRRYPHGILDQEREALTIEALVALGKVDEARARARAFERTYPASPHRARIEHALARAVGAEKEP